jgi:ABC-2 type transport system ATP-binding protein
VLSLVGLATAAHRRVRGFSLGMAQRLGIAAALLGDPPVLLLDEPVNGLDPEGVRWIRTYLRELAGQGRTVLVSSHLMSEMALTADHLVVIAKGRLLADASVQSFVDDDARSYVRVRAPEAERMRAVLAGAGLDVRPGADGAMEVRGAPPAAIGELAARNGLVVHEVSVQSVSLEEAFVQLTADGGRA